MRRLARPLLYLGTIAIVLGLGRYHAQFIGHYYFHSVERLPWNITYAAFLCIAAYGVGLPDLERQRSPWGAALGGVVVAGGAVSVVQIVLGSLLLPRFVVLLSAILCVPWFVFCAKVNFAGRTREEDRDRVILVAGPDEQAALREEMGNSLERPASLIVTMLPSDARASSSISKPLIESVLTAKGTVVVLDRVAALDDSIVAQAATLHEAGLRVRPLSGFYDEWLGKLPLSELERMSLMFDVGELHRARYGRLKRLADLAVAIIGLVALAILLPMVVVGNVIANPGPLLYRQQRVGRANAQFSILKLRTMKAGSEGAEWTAEGDLRITPFGRVLRRTHLDEVPQVINILLGELSVTGPRPEQPQYVAELRSKIPFYDLRHLVKPGLTGWAQVKYAYGANDLDALHKLQYDFYYLRHQSLGLDMRIVGRTIRSVMGRGGR